jgi:hypothetical protein
MISGQIEFMGLPGAGKSTVSKHLNKLLRSTSDVLSKEEAQARSLIALGAERNPRLRPLFHVAAGLRRTHMVALLARHTTDRSLFNMIQGHPELVACLHRMIDTMPGDVEEKAAAFRQALHVVTLYGLLSDSPSGGVVILDELFGQLGIQLLWRLRDPERSELQALYLEFIPKPKLVLHLKDDPRRCDARKAYFGDADPHVRLRKLNAMNECLHSILAGLRDGGVPVREVQGAGWPAITAKACRSEVLSIVGHDTGARSFGI